MSAEAAPAATVSREDGSHGRPRPEEEGASRGEASGGEDGAAGGGACQPRDAHSHSSSETCIPTPSCRICFQGAEQGDLLNPCRCDGSVRHTHQHCLLKWISERGSWTCELCCYRFQVVAVNMKRPWQWQAVNISLVEKVQMVAVFLGSLFLLASVSWLLWSALSPQAVWQRRDLLFQICYAMYGLMDLVCLGLIVHEGAAVYSVFLRWRAVNLHWDVRSYDKAEDMEEAGAGAGAGPAPPAPRTLWLPLVGLGPPGAPPATRPGRRWWSRRCWGPLCPRLLPRSSAGPEEESGEVVVRVTSV